MGATLSFELIAEGGAGPFEFDTNTKAIGDSLYIHFANERYQTYRKGDNIFSYKGYKETKISAIKSHFTHEFTPDDFDNAKIIENNTTSRTSLRAPASARDIPSRV